MLIPLTQGKVAIIDDDDFALVAPYKWSAARCPKSPDVFYARCSFIENGKSCRIGMHRHILGLTIGDGLEVDHADGDGLNNSRSNIRVCTHAENMKNKRKRRNSSTPFKSVYPVGKRYQARITVDGKRINLGMFDTAEEGHAAYVLAAETLHGEYANSGVHSSMK